MAAGGTPVSNGPHNGGCQCGAVRYRVEGPLEDRHICFCRMCQKAAGNYFMPLGKLGRAHFVVTRGEIAWFRSSEEVRRGFCRDCGTPLVYDPLDAATMSVTLGSLDDPDAAKPTFQCGPQAKPEWFGELDRLAWEEVDPAPWYDRVAPSNRQHPDHDTAAWPNGDQR